MDYFFYDLKGINSRVIYMYITILVKTVYLFISQVSGERLQDHWSSGFIFYLQFQVFINIHKKENQVSLISDMRVINHCHSIHLIPLSVFYVYKQLRFE